MKFILLALVFQFVISCWPETNILKGPIPSLKKLRKDQEPKNDNP